MTIAARTTMRTKAARTTARATAGTTSAENSVARTSANEMSDDSDVAMNDRVLAVQEDRVLGDNDLQSAVPAVMDNFRGIITDDFHEAHVGANRCFRGGIVELHTAAAEVREFRLTLGDRFYDFARVRLGLSPAMANFLLRVAEMGINPERFSPAVAVRMPCLMEALATVVAAYNNTGAIDNVAPAAANVTTAPADTMTTTMPAADSAVTPAAPKLPAEVTVATPPENTPVLSQVATDVVIGTTVLGNDTTVPGNNTMLMAENGSAVAPVGATEPPRTELTADQLRFIADRSVKLLLQVNRGELSADEAMRQAEKLPVRKTR